MGHIEYWLQGSFQSAAVIWCSGRALDSRSGLGFLYFFISLSITPTDTIIKVHDRCLAFARKAISLRKEVTYSGSVVSNLLSRVQLNAILAFCMN